MLVSVEEVRDYTQSEARDLSDETLELLIKAAGREFASHTQREFEATSGEATRSFFHGGGRFLDLAPYDVRSVTSLTTGTETTAPVVATGFRLRPLPAKDGVFQRIVFSTDLGECELSVKGLWGFASVPEDIKHLALATVTLWAKREIQVFERVYNVDEQYVERPRALPTKVVAALDDGYTRALLP